jgi:hypothetical protein
LIVLDSISSKQILNLINFLLALGLFITYYIYYNLQRCSIKNVVLILFGLSVVSSAIMTYLVDNYLLFNGSKSALFILNFNNNIFIASIFSVVFAFLIYNLLFTRRLLYKKL